MTIKDLRHLTGLTQEAFAGKYHIPRRTLQSWESGERKPPDYLPELLEYKIKHDYKSET